MVTRYSVWPATMGKRTGRRLEAIVFSTAVAAVFGTSAAPGPGPADTMTTACGQSPGIACRLVWDTTHSVKAAQLTTIYFAGPAHLALRVLFVILLAVIVRLAASRTIGKIAARAAKDDADGPERAGLLFGERRRQRATALASVLSNAATLTIVGITAVIIVGDLGLNLAPVLASAGVLGVALGFGAQTLVQDFLAGVFMLVEDQYGVGDVITVDGTTGTVEAVSLRVTRLRDVNGIVWHIRNGTIKQAGNESHGWARAVVDFPLPYDHEIPAVRQLMTRTARQMWQEAAWHDILLEEPEVWGVQSLSSDAIIMRVAARTAPLRQWEVQRELTERLKDALDAAGTPAEPTLETLSGVAATGDITGAAAKEGKTGLATTTGAAGAGPHGGEADGDGLAD
jgi:moderate conductance mechanosensitive channel